MSGITGKHGSVCPSSEEAGLVYEKKEKKLERSANIAFGHNHWWNTWVFYVPEAPLWGQRKAWSAALGPMSGSQPGCACCDERPLWWAWWAWHMQGCMGSKQDTAFRVIFEGFGIRAICSTLNSYFLFDFSCHWLLLHACRHRPASLWHALWALVPVPQHHFRASALHRTLCLQTCSGPAPRWGPASQHWTHSVPGCGPAVCPQLQCMSHQGPAVRHNI